MKKEYYYLLYDTANQEGIIYFGTLEEMAEFLGFSKFTILSQFSRHKTDKISVTYKNNYKRYNLERVKYEINYRRK